MLKKLSIASLLCLSASFAHAECFDGAGGQVCGPVTEYEITINQVELCKSNSCASPVIVSSTASSFDIAAASAGAAVGNYADLDDVAAGIYTHVRTTISPTIDFVAPALSPCGAVPASNPAITISSSVISTSELNNNPQFNLSWNSGETAFVHLIELDQPVVISKAGSLPQVQIDFSTANAHYCSTGTSTSLPGVPYVEVTVIPN